MHKDDVSKAVQKGPFNKQKNKQKKITKQAHHIHLFSYCGLDYERHFRFGKVPLKKTVTNHFK